MEFSYLPLHQQKIISVHKIHIAFSKTKVKYFIENQSCDKVRRNKKLQVKTWQVLIVRVRWEGRFPLYQIFIEIWVEDVRRYGHRDTRPGLSRSLLTIWHRRHIEYILRAFPKVQIPSRASTCRVASFLESWPRRARGHVQVFEAGGWFLLL